MDYYIRHHTRVLEIRQREIRQRRWKFVNGVGNSSTTFLSVIFRWKFVNNFSFSQYLFFWRFWTDSLKIMFHFVGNFSSNYIEQWCLVLVFLLKTTEITEKVLLFRKARYLSNFRIRICPIKLQVESFLLLMDY